MKIPIELNVIDGHTAYLNFWDAMHGRDVVCRIVGSKLLLQKFSGEDEDEEPTEKSITLAKWLKLIKQAKQE